VLASIFQPLTARACAISPVTASAGLPWGRSGVDPGAVEVKVIVYRAGAGRSIATAC